MKIQKLFTIDLELAIKLKESRKNASEIVNNLLKQYFESNNIGDLVESIEITEAKLAVQKEKIAEQNKEDKEFKVI